MLGLAVLFFLGLWIAFTIVAIWLGVKLTKKISSKKYTQYIGGLLGFMLTMGGFMVYWTIEYYQIQARVNYLCKTEGGLKVFVTPEQYKARLEKNDWSKLIKYEPVVKGKFKNTYIDYDGIDYELDQKNQDQIQGLNNSESLHSYVPYIKDSVLINYDNQNKVILSQLIIYNVSSGSIANELSALKFWMNNVKDCYSKSEMKEHSNLQDQYISYIKQESNHE